MKNGSLTARVCAQRFLERRAPSNTIFKRLENQYHLRAPVKLSKQGVVTDEEHELEVIQEEPHMGQCELARKVRISQSSICRIAKENKFYPYHITLVQGLRETNYLKKLNFCLV